MLLEYILDGHIPVAETDSLKWAQWFQKAERHVADDHVGQVRVSTIFLGLDHNHNGIGAPILFETMIFGGSYDQEQERYCTWEQAEEGHQRWLERIRVSKND